MIANYRSRLPFMDLVSTRLPSSRLSDMVAAPLSTTGSIMLLPVTVS